MKELRRTEKNERERMMKELRRTEKNERERMMKNILLTGAPGCGKSTLLERLIQDFPLRRGFLTKEIRKEGQRTGFELVTDHGETQLLASVHLRTPYKVSKYAVDVEGLERVLPPLFHYDQNQLLYIDEIGQMELYAPLFRKLVEQYLNSPNVFVGTLSAVYEDDFIAGIRKMKDVEIVEITVDNRAKKYVDVAEMIKEAMRER